MSDTFITVVGIMLAVILLFVTPVIVTSQRVDDMSQLDVETLTSNFVDEIRVAGKLTLEKYNQFIEKLTSTGNIYDVDIEIQEKNHYKQPQQRLVKIFIILYIQHK